MFPVWSEEEGFLQARRGEDCVPERARGALGEEDVFLREAEEDELEEFGEVEDAVDCCMR